MPSRGGLANPLAVCHPPCRFLFHRPFGPRRGSHDAAETWEGGYLEPRADTMSEVYQLCTECLTAYGDAAKGDVKIYGGFEPDGPSTCVCGAENEPGAGVPVSAAHYDKVAGPTKRRPEMVLPVSERPVDEVVEAAKPKLAYQNEELRIVISGTDFLMDIARRDSLGEIAWETMGRCAVEGVDVDSRCCRAIARLAEADER